MNVAKTWQLLPHDRTRVEGFAQALQLAPIIAQLLLNRGVADPENARRFLHAPISGLHDPGLLPGALAAAEVLYAAIKKGKRICVYGDYDTDGLTGTVILLQTIRLLGGTVDFYVPHRLEEGYSLNVDALTQIAGVGTSVVLTVDCGISSLEEAEAARRLGLELIVTDHHEMKATLPAASVLVHPRLPGSTYPFGGLSGSGVAFKVAWALCQRASGTTKVTPEFREFLIQSVGLAALGMIADCVPLEDENRIFVRHGLARLRDTASVGLKALFDVAGLGEKASISSTDVSYSIAPRLNAAGRLGCARLVVELLTTTSRERAGELARYLDGQNAQRQQIERRILEQARELVAGFDLEKMSALVLTSPEWHAGVIGIVAGRLSAMYSRPVLLIAEREQPAIALGSGRSIPGFALHEALQACSDGLISHGGHAAAAGFKIPHMMIDGFRERFCAYAARHFPAGPPTPRLVIDAEISFNVLTLGLVDALDRLEPFGAGNPKPLFLAGPVQVAGPPRCVGKGNRHLQFRVRQHDLSFKAIAFGLADRIEELMSAGGQCYLVFTPRVDEWQGWRRVQMEIVDFQPGVEARLG